MQPLGGVDDGLGAVLHIGQGQGGLASDTEKAGAEFGSQQGVPQVVGPVDHSRPHDHGPIACLGAEPPVQVLLDQLGLGVFVPQPGVGLDGTRLVEQGARRQRKIVVHRERADGDQLPDSCLLHGRQQVLGGHHRSGELGVEVPGLGCRQVDDGVDAGQ